MAKYEPASPRAFVHSIGALLSEIDSREGSVSVKETDIYMQLRSDTAK
jgi:hypothetical protein